MENERMVHHQFHKFMYGEAFREVLDTGAEALKKYGANKAVLALS